MPRRFPSLLPSLLPVILAVLLGGCARVSQLLAPPSPPAGHSAASPAPPARTAAIRLHAATGLNPDSRGQPLALLTRFYKLRHSAAFEQAPFDAFLSPAAEREAFGADLIEVKEVVLVPGQRYEVQEALGPEVAYVGVVGLFRAPAAQRWRLAFASEAAAKSGVTVGAHGCALAPGAGAPPLGQAATAGAAPCR